MGARKMGERLRNQEGRSAPLGPQVNGGWQRRGFNRKGAEVAKGREAGTPGLKGREAPLGPLGNEV